MAELSEHQKDTLHLAKLCSGNLRERFIKEVERLLKSQALPEEGYYHNTVHGVALENIANDFLGHAKDRDENYKNLQKF